MFRCDSDAGVFHGELHVLAFEHPRGDDDLAVGRELESVGDQVSEYLRNFAFIGMQGREFRCIFKDQINGLIVGEQVA